MPQPNQTPEQHDKEHGNLGERDTRVTSDGEHTDNATFDYLVAFGDRVARSDSVDSSTLRAGERHDR